MIKTKQERLKEVYDHVRLHFSIHTQRDFADRLRLTYPAMSSAMNGNKAYLTKNLFLKICAAFPGEFNLDYLLTGEGTLLSAEEEVKGDEVVAAHEEPAQYVPAWVESLLSIISNQIKENEALVRELRQTTSEVAALRDTLAEITQKLNKNI